MKFGDTTTLTTETFKYTPIKLAPNKLLAPLPNETVYNRIKNTINTKKNKSFSFGSDCGDFKYIPVKNPTILASYDKTLYQRVKKKKSKSKSKSKSIRKFSKRRIKIKSRKSRKYGKRKRSKVKKPKKVI